jgi:hypothetical protein
MKFQHFYENLRPIGEIPSAISSSLCQPIYGDDRYQSFHAVIRFAVDEKS